MNGGGTHESSEAADMNAFDKLPKRAREVLNYARYKYAAEPVLGMAEKINTPRFVYSLKKSVARDDAEQIYVPDCLCDEEKIIHLRSNGATLEQIAKKVGCNVHRVLKALG